MKLDALAPQDGKKLDAARKGPKAAAGFDALLSSAAAQPGARPQGSSADEKKARPISGTEEALLVARTLALPRAVPFIDTKAVDLKEPKGAKQPKAAAAVGAPVTLDLLAARAKATHEPLRVTAPGDKQPARAEAAKEPVSEPRARDGKKADELDASAARALTPAAPQAAAEPFRLEAPAQVHEAAPLSPVAPLLLEDASARIVLLPHVARMSVDTGDGGLLNVQLKVRDGVAELTAAGPASQLLEARQGELRVALAKEGLALGHFDLTQSGRQDRHAERPDVEAGATSTARRAASSSTSDTAVEDGRVHVKA